MNSNDMQSLTQSNQNSTFWLRAKDAILEGRLLSGLKRRIKQYLVPLAKAMLRRSWIKRSVLFVLNKSPATKDKLYRMVWKDVSFSPRAMRVYTALSTAIPTHIKSKD